MLRFILLLALLTAFPALSTDMYLPAIPFLEKIWNRPLAVINLSLILFFVVYCFCLLIYGPLSDRFGRKPPLIFGISAFIAGSLFCAASVNIEMLIFARIIQAAGAASAPSIAMAMAKDRLRPDQREKVLGYIAVIMAVAPMIAPMLGSLVIVKFSWRVIFLSQAFMGFIALVGVLSTKESNTEPVAVVIKKLVLNYASLFKNLHFMLIVIATSLIGIPFFGFIAASSSIYITDFNLSEKGFALFYGANALCFMIGAIICARLGRKIGSSRMISFGFGGIGLGGIIMALGFLKGPLSLALPMGIITFCLGLSRPPSNNLALEQVEKNAGSASSMLVFIYFIFGAFGMAAASLDWHNKVTVIGAAASFSGIAASLLWFYAKSRVNIPFKKV
jgi:DHA1 family bicyclomycin/chloramphenicol resistance-like MFS transporter